MKSLGIRQQSIVRPKYRTEWDNGIGMSPRETSRKGGKRRVKVVCIDFIWLTLTCHLTRQKLGSQGDFGDFKKQYTNIIALSSKNAATTLLER